MPTLYNGSHSNIKDAWKTFLSLCIYLHFFFLQEVLKAFYKQKEHLSFIHGCLLRNIISMAILNFFKKAMQFSGFILNFNKCFYANQHTNKGQGIPKLINRTSCKHINIKKISFYVLMIELEIWRNKIHL